MSHGNGVLVLGAGELGTAILKALVSCLKRGDTRISVLLRQSTISTQDPNKKAEIDVFKSLDITLVAGDIINDTNATLSAIFAPFDTVIGCFGMLGPAGTQLKIGKAVLQAKVPKYIPWQFGVDYDSVEYNAAGGLFSEQMDIRTLLRGQTGTKWVIISTGMFMSFIFETVFGIVSEDRRTVHALGSWDNRVTLTDVKDIGTVTADVVFSKPEIANQVVFCAGDTIEYRKVPKVLKDIGINVEVEEEWTVKYLKEELKKDPENGIKKYRVVFAEGNGLAWDESKTYNAAKGMKMVKLDDWVKENIKG